MKRFFFGLLWILACAFNWILYSYHFAVYPRDGIQKTTDVKPPLAEWIDKKDFGINQLVLSGSPYVRGENAGRLTQRLLEVEERELFDRFRTWVPSDLGTQALILFVGHWFHGIDRFFPNWATEEMYGVSQFAPHTFDFLADGFTRQVAYHGLHEVGQLLVDQKGDDMGCTVVATRLRGNWVLGRTFDFEAGRVFDDDKVLKWVFPDEGNAYVSVIWAGMVGGVTGINENGLYVSINAAGTTDFRRLGTPSTLILVKALQFSKDLDDAVEIIRREQMFITDIFVLMDAKSGRIVRIEKSPLHMEVLPLSSPVIVTNHLVSPRWENDLVNKFRRNELTSLARETRGRELVRDLDARTETDARAVELGVLKILRDKGMGATGEPLPLGDRQAIDSLIATHAVLYNGATRVLYVSQGPSLVGKFLGFDLDKSFAMHRPVAAGELPVDSSITKDQYFSIHRARRSVNEAERASKARECGRAEQALSEVAPVFRRNSDYLTALGNLEFCKGHVDEARKAWTAALKQGPAYAKEIKSLQEKLKWQ